MKCNARWILMVAMFCVIDPIMGGQDFLGRDIHQISLDIKDQIIEIADSLVSAQGQKDTLIYHDDGYPSFVKMGLDHQGQPLWSIVGFLSSFDQWIACDWQADGLAEVVVRSDDFSKLDHPHLQELLDVTSCLSASAKPKQEIVVLNMPTVNCVVYKTTVINDSTYECRIYHMYQPTDGFFTSKLVETVTGVPAIKISWPFQINLELGYNSVIFHLKYE